MNQVRVDEASRSAPARRHERPAPVARRATAALPRAIAMATALSLVLIGGPAAAGGHTWFQARGGLDLAHAAAQAWAPDAALVYLENDEPLDPAGAASRWGYLFYSPSLNKARVYSVRSGKIVVAEDLGMKLESPPVAQNWIDSNLALEIADREAGRAFCSASGGRLQTMLLMRGAFEDGDPDETTWTIVYSAKDAPGLFVVIGADGKVRRTWRG